MKTSLLWYLVVIAGNAVGQPFALVKDINPSRSNNVSLNYSPLIKLNGNFFMTVNTPGYGSELWKVNGSTGEKSLVKDIYPGSKSGGADGIIVYNGLIYFTANNGISGSELWKSDGTLNGTTIVKDINPGIGSSSPISFVIYNNLLFFSATSINVDGSSNHELWKSDGTELGTVMVKDIYPGSRGSLPTGFTIMKGILYFSAEDPDHGTELWRSDGSESGTFMLRDLYPGSTFYGFPNHGRPGNLTVVNDVLYFDAAGNYSDLWRSDGTTDGTTIIKNISPGSPTATTLLASHAVLNYKLYFSKSGPLGNELWGTDGTPAGTLMIKKFLTGICCSPISMLEFNGAIFLTVNKSNGKELWKTNGTEIGTVKLFQGDISSIVADQHHLYFTNSDLNNGRELWVTQGTIEGTNLLKDIEPGTTSSNPTSMQLVDGQVYFQALTSLHGLSIWKTDGTVTGTNEFISFPVTTNNSNPQNLIGFKNALYFFANDSAHGTELWKSDGTESGTALVKDITPGGSGTDAANFVGGNSTLYFKAFLRLWKTDGTDAGTIQVHPDIFLNDESAVTAGKWLFFVGSNNVSGGGNQLWKTDGTKDGTVPVKAISPSGYPSGNNLTVFNGNIFFSNTQELWKIDTITWTPVLVKNIGVGSIYNLTATEDLLYFKTYDALNLRTNLWKSDGTDVGTTVINILPDVGGIYPDFMMPVGDELYFNAKDAVHGTELWKTNGMVNGTLLVKDLNPGPEDALIRNPITVNETLFFDSYDPAHGVELWKTNGTDPGTVMIKDLWNGPGGNQNGESISAFKSSIIEGRLIITRNDGINGEEPWVTDGSELGTLLIQDILTGSVGSSPNNYCVVGDKLYFTAEDAIHGVELWVGKTADIFPKFQFSFDGRIENNNVSLEWKTVNELNQNKFEIQRSKDARNFITIGERTAKGAIGMNADYNFTDPNVNLLNTPVIYYRLSIKEISGEITFSDTVRLIMDNAIQTWPNPIVRDLNVQFTLTESDNISVILYDQNGNAAIQKDFYIDKGVFIKSLNFQSLPTGIYYLKVRGKSIRTTKKLIKSYRP